MPPEEHHVTEYHEAWATMQTDMENYQCGIQEDDLKTWVWRDGSGNFHKAAEAGTSLASQGVVFVNSSSQLDTDESYFYYDETQHQLLLGSNSATAVSNRLEAHSTSNHVRLVHTWSTGPTVQRYGNIFIDSSGNLWLQGIQECGAAYIKTDSPVEIQNDLDVTTGNAITADQLNSHSGQSLFLKAFTTNAVEITTGGLVKCSNGLEVVSGGLTITAGGLDMNSTNISNVGTIGCGAITSTGTFSLTGDMAQQSASNSITTAKIVAFSGNSLLLRDPADQYGIELDTNARIIHTTTQSDAMTINSTVSGDFPVTLEVYKNSTGVNGHDLGEFRMTGQSTTSVKRTYASIYGEIETATNGSEDGNIVFEVIDGGTPGSEEMRIKPGAVEVTNFTKLGGDENLKVYSGTYDITSDDTGNGYSNITVTSVTLTNVRGLSVNFYDASSGGVYPCGDPSPNFDGRLTSSTNLYVDYQSGTIIPTSSPQDKILYSITVAE